MAGTSRGSVPGDSHAGRAETGRTPQGERIAPSRGEDIGQRRGGPVEVLALREGEALPEGYTLVQRGPGNVKATNASTDVLRTPTVDLTTPPERGPDLAGADGEASKRAAAAKRNATKSLNKQAHATFAKEMKEATKGGRAPKLKLSNSAKHLKARWHAAAKEIAYKLLDLRKDSWKSYSSFEKAKVHKELNRLMKFDPPLEGKEVDKFLAGHLRSARSCWKAHWQKYGPEQRHHNCPEEAWAELVKWWNTPECEEEAAEMAGRRSLQQSGSKMGRKALVERMNEEDEV